METVLTITNFGVALVFFILTLQQVASSGFADQYATDEQKTENKISRRILTPIFLFLALNALLSGIFFYNHL